MEAQTEKMKMVYTVVERAPGKTFWVRIGVGFVNRDGSLNLKLDAIPVNGTLQVRDWDGKEYEKKPTVETLDVTRPHPLRDDARLSRNGDAHGH